MGRLGEVLELMAEAGRPGHQLRGVVHHWRHLERQARAAERAMQDEVARGRCSSPPPRRLVRPGDPAELAEDLVLEVRPPEVVRVERLTVPVEPTLRCGFLPYWVQELAPLLAAPLPLAMMLRLTVTGTGEVEGRSTVRLTGHQRPLDQAAARLLERGVDDHVLDVDAERGVLLRIADRLDGAEAQVVTVRPFADDEPLPAAPPPVMPATPAVAPPVELPLEEVARRVFFTVLRPRRGPDGATMTTQLHGKVVSTTMALLDGRFAVRIEQRPVDDECDEDLSRWEHAQGGQEVRYCWTARHVDPRYSEELVLVDREGTRVMLRSRLSRAMLLEIAESLDVLPSGR